jgi:hypothetical protein
LRDVTDPEALVTTPPVGSNYLMTAVAEPPSLERTVAVTPCRLVHALVLNEYRFDRAVKTIGASVTQPGTVRDKTAAGASEEEAETDRELE